MKSLLLIQDNKNSMTSDYIQKHIEQTENLLNKDLKYPNDEKFQNISLFFKKLVEKVKDYQPFDSLIIKDSETQQKFMKELFEENKKLELVFRGSKDSFTSSKFHEKL